MFTRIRRSVVALVALFALGASVSMPSGAATSSVNVSLDVASATNVSTTACDSGAAVSFGVVQPNIPATTSADCVITFGSSNDTSSLRVSQSDGAGDAMYLPADGTLDSGYGTGGIRAETAFPGRALDGVMQADGKFVMVGNDANQIVVARFNVNGSLDPTFNTVGYRLIDVGNCPDEAFAVALENDGDIVIAGRRMLRDTFSNCDTIFTSNAFDLVLARVQPDGQMDSGFGTAGVLQLNRAAYENYVGLAIDPAGNYVLAGGNSVNLMSWDSVGIRITPAGVVDASRTFALGLSGWNDTFTRVVALPDGSVRFIGGAQVTAGGDYDTTIAGVTPTFAIDTAFGTGATGKLRIDLGGNDAAYGVARQVDGQLLVSGFANGDAVVARVAVNGAGLDGSFGAAGRRSVDLGSGDDSGSRMVLEEDGRILVTGSTSWGFSGGTPGSDLALFRLTTSGALDTTFDQDGIRLFDVGGDRDMGFGIAPVVDGTIMVAGVSTVAGVERFTSIRMSGATVENWLDGSRDWDQGASAFGACLKATALASPVWTIHATCAPVDGSQWNDIPASQDVIATTASGQSTATATMRFGLRAAMSQRPGSYIAPVTFTVLAPG